MTVGRYILNVLIAFDMLCNAILFGSPDETISARAARLRYRYPRSWGTLAQSLDYIQHYHSSMAIDHDEGRGERIMEREQEAGEAMADAVDAEIRKEREA